MRWLNVAIFMRARGASAAIVIADRYRTHATNKLTVQIVHLRLVAVGVTLRAC